MESAGGSSDGHRDRDRERDRGNLGNSSLRRYRFPLQLSASNFIRSPVSALLEYSGLLRPRSESEPLIGGSGTTSASHTHHDSSPNGGEVSIRIIGATEQDHDRVDPTTTTSMGAQLQPCPTDVSAQSVPMAVSSLTTDGQDDSRGDRAANGDAHGGVPQFSSSTTDAEAADGGGANNRDATYQRYDIQQAARWIEQVLPFSVLLIISNDILRKQTALKGERKISVLVGICILFTLHVAGVYWWFRHDDLLYPLVMLPPKEIPPFWHAIFIIMVNDTLVRQAAMVAKCILLMYYKNSRGRNYRRQGQMLTLVEYLLLLYRALLPTPVWYRFFLNKEYGSLFSSLMTGLYLTFKLTSVVEKVQSFFAAVKALSRKEIHYGAYATSEQVTAAGDMCAICQEKMHAPILLRCKHIFCEDCVSEWFERERTCPLCRALVKPADLKSFGDGSTSLFFQLF
ncbi:RING finger and transmembrane domain-containing protein 2 [Bienertia sinuspersici]